MNQLWQQHEITFPLLFRKTTQQNFSCGCLSHSLNNNHGGYWIRFDLHASFICLFNVHSLLFHAWNTELWAFIMLFCMAKRNFASYYYLSISDTFLPSSGEKRLFHSFYNTQRRLLFATWLNIDYYYSWSHHIKTASQKVFCKWLHTVVTYRTRR